MRIHPAERPRFGHAYLPQRAALQHAHAELQHAHAGCNTPTPRCRHAHAALPAPFGASRLPQQRCEACPHAEGGAGPAPVSEGSSGSPGNADEISLDWTAKAGLSSIKR